MPKLFMTEECTCSINFYSRKQETTRSPARVKQGYYNLFGHAVGDRATPESSASPQERKK